MSIATIPQTVSIESGNCQTVHICFDESVAILSFAYNESIINRIRSIPWRKWNKEERVWTIPLRSDIKRFLIETFHPVARCIFDDENSNLSTEASKTDQTSPILKKSQSTISTNPPPLESQDFKSQPTTPLVPQKYIDLLTKKRYSLHTIRNYCKHLELCCKYHNKTIDQIRDDDISAYMLYCSKNEHYSVSYQRVAIHAIKFYFNHFRKDPLPSLIIPWPKGEKKLPVVFSTIEVQLLLSCIKNLKHKCILCVIYSGGLRISEAVRLKINDIDFSRMQIHIRNAKGKKDRYTLLSEKAADLLKKYIADYNPVTWLFQGQKGGIYSIKSIQNIFHKARLKAGIQKNATVHTLRYPNLNKIQTFFKRTWY